MNVITKKKPTKNEKKPLLPVVNSLFAKPRDFLNQFAATKKPGLLESTYQQYEPTSKYESTMVDRGSLNALSSSVPASNQSSRKVSFGENFSETRPTISSSSAYRLELRSPSSTFTNLSLSKPTSSDFRTPSSSSRNKKHGGFANTSSSSRTKGTKATPKSSSSGTTTTSNQSRVIVAVTEGRGNARGEVGLAAMDVLHPCLIMCQIIDTLSYYNTMAMLNVLNPSVLLFPHTIADNQKNSKLFQTIQKKFPHTTQTSVHRKFYNDEDGMSMVKSLHLPEFSSIELLVIRKYFALAAAGALTKYIEYVENVTLASGTIPMEYVAIDKVMMIDFDTMHHLELILSQVEGSVSRSLHGILNHCFTFGGKRRLRSAILQPSYVEKDLNDRLDCVTELVENTELRQNIQHTLAKIPDVESLLKICFIPINQKADDSSISMMNYIILLKTILDVIPNLHEILTMAKTKYFEKVAKCLNDQRLRAMAEEMDRLLDKDTKRVSGYASSQFQRCFAIKAEINGLLDVARYTYSELINQFQAQVVELAAEHEMPLKSANTSTKGFHITFKVQGQHDFKLENLPPVFIQVQKTKNVVTMTTKDLIFMNERITQALQEVQLMSNAVLQELLQKIRGYTGCLYNLCDSIAELDLIVSLSRVSSSTGYVRPIFGSKLALKSARHPILDFTSPSVPVGNDVMATDTRNFHIITGPNMGGKSIYIKQIALIQIMAQIGCYVPAQQAELKLMDHLFTRINFNDNLECNASHFTLELKEMEYILRTATKNSLIIIDEFCRGSAGAEGSAIAWTISEVFINSVVYVFFATHFHFLTQLQDLYPQVSCWYFNADIYTPEGCTRPRLKYPHKLSAGVVSIEHYGLKLAESTALPQSMKEAAYECAQNLAKTKKQFLGWHMMQETKKEAAADKLYFELLDIVDDDQLTQESLAAAIANCGIDVAEFLLSAEKEKSNVHDDNNADAEILESLHEEINKCSLDALNFRHKADTTYDKINLDDTFLSPEGKNESLRTNALDKLKQYRSFDDSDVSQMNSQNILNSSCERRPTSSAWQDSFDGMKNNKMDLESSNVSKVNLDITMKQMDFSYNNFAAINSQNASSTPMSSTSWRSEHLTASLKNAQTNGCASMSRNMKKDSPELCEENLGLHSPVKRFKKMSNEDIEMSPSIVSHSNKIEIHTPTSAREFLSSDTHMTGSTSQKNSKSLETLSDLRTFENFKTNDRGGWCSTAQSASVCRSFETQEEEISPSSRKSSCYRKSEGSFSDFIATEGKNSKTKSRDNSEKFSEFNDSDSAMVRSHHRYTYSKPDLKPNLHDISLISQCSSLASFGRLNSMENYNMSESVPPNSDFIDPPKYSETENVARPKHEAPKPPVNKTSEPFVKYKKREKFDSTDDVIYSQSSNILDSFLSGNSFTKFNNTNPILSMQSGDDSSFDFHKAKNDIFPTLEHSKYNLFETTNQKISKQSTDNSSFDIQKAMNQISPPLGFLTYSPLETNRYFNMQCHTSRREFQSSIYNFSTYSPLPSEEQTVMKYHSPPLQTHSFHTNEPFCKNPRSHKMPNSSSFNHLSRIDFPDNDNLKKILMPPHQNSTENDLYHETAEDDSHLLPANKKETVQSNALNNLKQYGSFCDSDNSQLDNTSCSSQVNAPDCITLNETHSYPPSNKSTPLKNIAEDESLLYIDSFILSQESEKLLKDYHDLLDV